MLYNRLILVNVHHTFSLIPLKYHNGPLSYQGSHVLPAQGFPLPPLLPRWLDRYCLMITQSVASRTGEVSFLLVPGFLQWTHVSVL